MWNTGIVRYPRLEFKIKPLLIDCPDWYRPSPRQTLYVKAAAQYWDKPEKKEIPGVITSWGVELYNLITTFILKQSDVSVLRSSWYFWHWWLWFGFPTRPGVPKALYNSCSKCASCGWILFSFLTDKEKVKVPSEHLPSQSACWCLLCFRWLQECLGGVLKFLRRKGSSCSSNK